MPPPPLRLRDHLRGAFVLFHVAAVTLLAVPSPGEVTRKELRKPSLVETMEAGAQVLGALGQPTSVEALSESVYQRAKSLQSARRTLLSPLRPYERIAGVEQGWTMFGIANLHPGRLEVYVRGAVGGQTSAPPSADGWRLVYRSRDPELDWRAGQLDEERIRTLVNNFSWRRGHSGWGPWVDWLAGAAAADFPEATALKAQMVSMRIPPPAELRATGALREDAVYWPEERSLDRLRGQADR